MNGVKENTAEEEHVDKTYEWATIAVPYALCGLVFHLVVVAAARIVAEQWKTPISNWIAIGLATVFFSNVAAQGIAIVVYAGLAVGRSTTRVVLAGSLIFIGSFVMAVGLSAIWGGSIDGSSRVAFSGFMLLVFCLALIPFWVLRVGKGWRIGPVPADEAQRRFRPEHLFGWVTFLVLPLFLLRMFISGSEGGFNLLFVVYGGLVILMGFASASAFIYSAGVCRHRMALCLVVPISGVAAIILRVVAGLIVTGPIRGFLPFSFVVHLIVGWHLSLLIIGLNTMGWHFSTFRTRIREGVESESPSRPSAIEKPAPHPLD